MIRLIDQWAALTRSTNVLLVIDVSASMGTVVSGTGHTRLERVKEAAAAAVRCSRTRPASGCWEFSTAIDGDLDYRALVPPAGSTTSWRTTGCAASTCCTAIAGLVPRQDTGLYNTVAAAYEAVLANYDEESRNLVVVITDGSDDTGGRAGPVPAGAAWTISRRRRPPARRYV